jgi:arsenite methyltransferase
MILSQKLCIVGNDKSDFFNRMSPYVDSVIYFLLAEKLTFWIEYKSLLKYQRMILMINVNHDSESLAEMYDKVSKYQYINGLALVKKLNISSKHKVLDVGCGTGRLTLKLASKVDHITGIDPSLQRIEVARRKLTKMNPENVTFELGSSDDIGRYGEEVFDVVYLNAVFHWINDKEDVLNNIYQVLKPGGKLGICTGDKDHPFTVKMILNEVLKKAEITDEGADFSAPVNTVELDSLLKKSGFRVIKIKLKRDPRYFETPAKCLEYVEASSFGNFLGNIPVSVHEKVKAEIMAELEKYQTPKGIENVSHILFALAEKSLDKCHKKS